MFTYKLKKLYRYKMIPFLILFSITMGIVAFFLHFNTTNHAFDFLFSNDMSFFIFFPTFCFCKFLNGKKNQKVLIYILKTDSLKVNWEMQLEFLNLFIFPSS